MEEKAASDSVPGTITDPVVPEGRGTQDEAASPIAAASRSLPLVGIDDGYAAIKLAWRGPRGETHTAQIPSRAAVTGEGALSVDGRYLNSYETAEGLCFAVDESLIESEDTRFDEYPISPLNRVLVAHALRRFGFTGPVRVAVGLPVEDYYTASGLPNRALLKRKREQHRSPVRALDGGRMPDIRKVTVVSEAVAAFLDDEEARRGAIASACVLDIGGRTADIAVLQRRRGPGGQEEWALLKPITRRDVGCLKAIHLLAGEIARAFGVPRISDAAAEKALRDGRISLYGREHDVGELRDRALKGVKAELAMVVSASVRPWAAQVDRVILVGGGAHYFADAVDGFANLKVASSPEYANARGMLRWLARAEDGGSEPRP